MRVQPGGQPTLCKLESWQKSWRNTFKALVPTAKSSRGFFTPQGQIEAKSLSAFKSSLHHFPAGEWGWSLLGSLCFFFLHKIRLEIIKAFRVDVRTTCWLGLSLAHSKYSINVNHFDDLVSSYSRAMKGPRRTRVYDTSS